MPTKSIFVKCICNCSVIEFQYNHDEESMDVSVWTSHPGRILSHEERIRWCDHIMKTGDPWADYTIVNKEDAMRIAEYIKKHITSS